jgi:hypothetical protein
MLFLGPNPERKLIEIGIASNRLGALKRYDKNVGGIDAVLHYRGNLIRRIDHNEFKRTGLRGKKPG